ncbi:MAG TPA: histidine kinase dimerization/phospho-acceptor domain-containing protein [Gemmatimonadaceae bacterium]|nr:histidine kinase dimerization/phospho-acceptor domain-containing protein [Gemmatimonadaceae bacterium]
MLESSQSTHAAAASPREGDARADELRSLRQQLALKSSQLEESEERLLEAVALARRQSEILAMYAHDLRSPLAAIIGYADLLEMGLPEAIPHCAQESVSRIRDAAVQLQLLIDHLLATPAPTSSAH